MKLPDPKDVNAYVEALMGKEWGESLKALAKPINPLRECSPQPWDTTPRHCEDISHDCA